MIDEFRLFEDQCKHIEKAPVQAVSYCILSGSVRMVPVRSTRALDTKVVHDAAWAFEYGKQRLSAHACMY